MASSQVNPKNKKDTLRDMFDDSHADANPDDSAMDTRDNPDDATADAGDLDGDLDDSVKDPDFDPSKEKEEDDDDDVKVVKDIDRDPALDQLKKANLKLQKSVKKIPGLHPDDKCRFEKYSASIWN